jgi:hypothetical protein
MSHVGRISTPGVGASRPLTRAWAPLAILSAFVALFVVAVLLSATPAGEPQDGQAFDARREFTAGQGYGHPRAVPPLRLPRHAPVPPSR